MQITCANSNFSNRKIRLVSLMSFAAAILSACGGGGDGGGSGVPSAPSGPPTERAAVASVPAASYDDVRRKLAFDRLNEARAAAGIGLLTQQKLVDVAAQNHSDYMALNHRATHQEDSALPGFTGDSANTRVGHAGYQDFNSIIEMVAGWGYDPAAPMNVGANLIDALLGAPYHRNGLLDATERYVGIGVSTDASGQYATLAVNVVSSNENRQGAPNTLVSIWPPANSIDIPTMMSNETPDPIPENKGAPAGYAASVQTNGYFRGVDATRCEMSDSSGNPVDTKMLSYGVDPNTSADFAACLPRAPLKKNTRYTVTIAGYLTDAYTGKTDPLVKTWSFTTGSKDRF